MEYCTFFTAHNHTKLRKYFDAVYSEYFLLLVTWLIDISVVGVLRKVVV
jgi:hypothetical protein